MKSETTYKEIESKGIVACSGCHKHWTKGKHAKLGGNCIECGSKLEKAFELKEAK